MTSSSPQEDHQRPNRPDAIGSLAEPTGPALYVEIRLSRQYRVHVLIIPGGGPPTYWVYLADALSAAKQAGIDRLTLVADDEQYSVEL